MRSPWAERWLPPAGTAGSVTAELAVGMVGVVVALAAVLSVATAAQAQVAVESAAAAGARAAARGDGDARVVATATARGGPGSAVRLSAGGAGLVEVRVSRRVRLALPGAPVVTVTGRATAAAEGPA